MPLDTAVARSTSRDLLPVRPRTTARRIAASNRAAANDGLAHEDGHRPIDPMLLVFEERVRTFRLLAKMIRNALGPLPQRA